MTGHEPKLASLPPGPPLLQVIVDTEEEFDWFKPFNRNSVAVTAMQSQHRAQELFAPYGLKPTYVVDYPVATTPDAVAALSAFRDAGQCQIGTHLHPWVNPPHEELVTAHNSYACNLPASLERRKLTILTEAITKAFGSRPLAYKAGRYGIGPATVDTLEALGYRIDLSVVPHSQFGADGGPDFRGCPDRPYWFGPSGALLELPLARGFSGALASHGPRLHGAAESHWGRKARVGGVLARLGLLERATLTPEGNSFPEIRRLIASMLRQGHQVFSLTYHSPSLAPGHTPYVRTQADLQRFLDIIKRTLEFFLEEMGGRPTTPFEVHELALASRPAAS